MTTEVITMNRYGVALAADSAITVDDRKVYNTGNKIFPLGNNHQVAIMTYGKGHLMNVPWSVIINTFGNFLPHEPLQSVEQYVEQFLHYMNNYDYEELMSSELEGNFVKELLYTKIDYLISCCKKMHRQIFKEHYKKLTMEQSQHIYNQKMEMMLRKIVKQYETKPFYEPFSEDDFKWLTEIYSDQLLKYLHEEMLSCFRTKEICKHMLMIAYHSLLRKNEIYRANLVFVGYGQKNLLPEMITVEVGTKINGKLKYKLNDEQKYKMDMFSPGKIFTFGRSRMIKNFLSGIHPEMEDYLFDRLNEKLANIPDEIKQLMSHYLPDQLILTEVTKTVEKKLINIYYTLQEDVLVDKQNHFVNPIESLITAMPPQDLGDIAGKLVAIEIFKSKLSKHVEKTTGPIDVATITKDVGFNWVRGKNNQRWGNDVIFKYT